MRSNCRGSIWRQREPHRCLHTTLSTLLVGVGRMGIGQLLATIGGPGGSLTLQVDHGQSRGVVEERGMRGNEAPGPLVLRVCVCVRSCLARCVLCALCAVEGKWA